MRKIRIIAVGKDKDHWVADGLAHYTKLLGRYASVEIETIAKGRATAATDPESIKQDEAEAILKRVGDASFVALHDRGEVLNSVQFSRALEKLTANQRGVLTFVIGGAYGLDKSVQHAATKCLSLSPLTFSHQIARMVLVEQLYRAFTILEGTDYHK
jgi:23S rRNA (pseudouridine1915-N3)-methyltransferase